MISKLGLAFRGSSNNIFSPSRGNYLSHLHYLGEFDEFLKHHIKMYANCVPEKQNYLSYHTCEEFISLIASKTREVFIAEIKQVFCFSLIIDSTPDISHNDQLSVIMRYVTANSIIKETFIGFINISHHNSSYLEEVILKKLDEMAIDISMCRGQAMIMQPI